jgi:very-short-patch-repair endonuclease
VTSDLRTVLDCAVLLPLPDALAVADSALRLKRLTRTALLRAAEESRGPGRVRRVRLAQVADGAAANPFESALRALALRAGLRGARAQVAVLTHGGTFTVDVGDEQLRLALEADSFEWHGDRQALERDCRRYDELQRAGWTVLRFAWEHVMFSQEWVACLIRDVRQRAEVAAPTRSRHDLLRP